MPAEDKIKEMGIEAIDRLYVCEDCESSFVFRKELKFHEESTGHKNIREFPL